MMTFICLAMVTRVSYTMILCITCFDHFYCCQRNHHMSHTIAYGHSSLTQLKWILLTIQRIFHNLDLIFKWCWTWYCRILFIFLTLFYFQYLFTIYCPRLELQPPFNHELWWQSHLCDSNRGPLGLQARMLTKHHKINDSSIFIGIPAEIQNVGSKSAFQIIMQPFWQPY